MKGRNVLITGCSSGIGYCIASGLRDRGYRVIATARKPDDVDKLKSSGYDAFQIDLANSSSIQSAFREIISLTNGEIHALFNNAAYGQPGAVEDLSREVLQRQFETNLFGTHELTNLVIPYMRQQCDGRIIQNSSVLGFIALKYRGAYIATKFALEGLSDTLRMELKDSGIHVSLIEPGPVSSEFRKNAYAAFRENIDIKNSHHFRRYALMEERFKNDNLADPFTLKPEAVLRKVIHALESKRPRDRYYVTIPTYAFAFLKRVFPGRLMDQILLRI